MLKKQKRDNDYYLGRLEKEHPSVYADYDAGKYDSARAAFKAAGLRKPPSPLAQLKNAWRKASGAEQAIFRDFISSDAARRAELEELLKGMDMDDEPRRRKRRRSL